MRIGRRGSAPTRPGNAESAKMTFLPRRHAHFQTCVFECVCNFRRCVVIGALLASSLHHNVLRASTAWTHDSDASCENSASRRDWRSSGHLLEGLGPHASDPGSPKWLPQATFKATTNNSAYRRDWCSPGAPIIPKWASGLDGVRIFNNVCVCICL